MSNSPEGQREACATMQDLLGTCVVCNVFFERRQHNQITCGADKCRKYRQQYRLRELHHEAYVELTWSRRRAKSLTLFRVRSNGPQTHDHYQDKERYVKDTINKYSRCTQCGVIFVDGQGRETPSGFEFCGESLLLTGECKKMWLAAREAARPQTTHVPGKFKHVTPEDTKPTKRVRAPKTVDMPRNLMNFCCNCIDVVVGKDGKEIRRTRGMYRPVNHDCGEVRTI